MCKPCQARRWRVLPFRTTETPRRRTFSAGPANPGVRTSAAPARGAGTEITAGKKRSRAAYLLAGSEPVVLVDLRLVGRLVDVWPALLRKGRDLLEPLRRDVHGGGPPLVVELRRLPRHQDILPLVGDHEVIDRAVVAEDNVLDR